MLKNKTINSLTFNFLFAGLLILFNFSFFKFSYSLLDANKDFFMMFMMPPILFAGFLFIINLLFLPYLTKPLAIIFYLISSLALYFLLSYGTIIDHDMIKNVIQTDSKEVKSLINIRLILWIIFVVILPIIILSKTKIIYKTFKKELKQRLIILGILLAFIGTSFAFLSKDYFPFFREHRISKYYLLPSQPISGVFAYIKREKQKKALPFQKIAEDAKRTSQDKKLLVLVIGETARAANMSSNGYQGNDTNFYTKQIPNLITFSSLYSCGTATGISLPCMFSSMPRKNYNASKAENSENVLDILQKTGVKVFWLGNNSGSCKGVCDRIPETISFDGEDSGFDEKILTLALNDIQASQESTIITLHLQGSHGPTYFERYPDNFKKFTPTCNTSRLQDCTKEEIYNTYDNTLLYTDYIIYTLVQALEKKEQDFSEVGLLYMSDHGESLGENGLYLHGLPYAIAPDFQKHIAAQMWLASKDLSNLKDKKLSQDNLFHTLLGYFDINTTIYDKNLDINKDIK